MSSSHPERGLAVEGHLRAKRESGGKALVSYMTGGLGPDWVRYVEAMSDAGADVVEIGVPFSDPVMDGPTIQEASGAALAAGANPSNILDGIAGASIGVPLVAMTYYNLVARAGHLRFARQLASAGVRGAIVADIPLEESGDWEAQAAGSGVETILLAAPVSSDERLAEICGRSHGFVYGVNVMGVTGERAALSQSAGALAKRLKAITDLPVIMGFGVSTPDQAAEVASYSDGAVVASALMRMVLDGADSAEVADAVSKFRRALDRG